MIGEIVKLINGLSQTNILLYNIMSEPGLSETLKNSIYERIKINKKIITETSSERRIDHA